MSEEKERGVKIEKKRSVGMTIPSPSEGIDDRMIPSSFMHLANNMMAKSYTDYGYGKSNIPSQEKRAKLRKKRKKRRR